MVQLSFNGIIIEIPELTTGTEIGADNRSKIERKLSKVKTKGKITVNGVKYKWYMQSMPEDNVFYEWCNECGRENKFPCEEGKLSQNRCETSDCKEWLRPCAICPENGDCSACPFISFRNNKILEEGTTVIIKRIDDSLADVHDMKQHIGKVVQITDNYTTTSGVQMYTVNIETDRGVLEVGVSEHEIELYEVEA